MVIAIIALLAGLLSPALKSARDAGQSAQCVSNLRQISLAFHLYVESNDGWAPNYQDTNEWDNVDWWYGKIAPYANNNQKIFVNCPTAKDRRYYYAQVAYGMNWRSYIYVGLYKPFRFDSQIRTPTKTIAFADSSWEKDGGADGARGVGIVYTFTGPFMPHFRHANRTRANFIFYDQHAASYDPSVQTNYGLWDPY